MGVAFSFLCELKCFPKSVFLIKVRSQIVQGNDNASKWMIVCAFRFLSEGKLLLHISQGKLFSEWASFLCLCRRASLSNFCLHMSQTKLELSETSGISYIPADQLKCGIFSKLIQTTTNLNDCNVTVSRYKYKCIERKSKNLLRMLSMPWGLTGLAPPAMHHPLENLLFESPQLFFLREEFAKASCSFMEDGDYEEGEKITIK